MPSKTLAKQTSRNVLARMFRILECCYPAVIVAIDLHALIDVLVSDLVAAQRFADRWSDESAQLFIVGHRIAELFEGLHHGGNNARMRGGQGAVQVQQNQAAR